MIGVNEKVFWTKVASHITMILAYTGNPLGNIVMEVLNILSGCMLALPAVETEVTIYFVYLVILFIILMDDPSHDGLLDLELAIVSFASNSS